MQSSGAGPARAEGLPGPSAVGAEVARADTAVLADRDAAAPPETYATSSPSVVNAAPPTQRARAGWSRRRPRRRRGQEVTAHRDAAEGRAEREAEDATGVVGRDAGVDGGPGQAAVGEWKTRACAPPEPK